MCASCPHQTQPTTSVTRLNSKSSRTFIKQDKSTPSTALLHSIIHKQKHISETLFAHNTDSAESLSRDESCSRRDWWLCKGLPGVRISLTWCRVKYLGNKGYSHGIASGAETPKAENDVIWSCDVIVASYTVIL